MPPMAAVIATATKPHQQERGTNTASETMPCLFTPPPPTHTQVQKAPKATLQGSSSPMVSPNSSPTLGEAWDLPGQSSAAPQQPVSALPPSILPRSSHNNRCPLPTPPKHTPAHTVTIYIPCQSSAGRTRRCPTSRIHSHQPLPDATPVRPLNTHNSTPPPKHAIAQTTPSPCQRSAAPHQQVSLLP
jgi:hypothetical protein